MKIKSLKNKILVFSLSFLSLFSFGYTLRCGALAKLSENKGILRNNVKISISNHSEDISEDISEGDFGFRYNKGKSNDFVQSEKEVDKIDNNLADKVPKEDRHSLRSDDQIVYEKGEFENDVDFDKEPAMTSNQNEGIILGSDSDDPERNKKRLDKKKIRNLLKLRQIDAINGNHTSGYSSVGSKGRNVIGDVDKSKSKEFFEGLYNSGLEFPVNFDILEKVEFPIHLDCVIPLSTSSRPFLFSCRFDLKPLVTPLDLVSRCSLNKAIGFFESNFSDFFVDIRKIRQKGFSETFFVKDLKNGLCSSWSFEKNVRFGLAKKGICSLRELYLNHMHDVLERSGSVGLICDGDYPSKSLINFVRRFARLYPDKVVTLINIDVVRGIGGLHISSPFASDKLKVVQFIVPERNIDKWDGIAYCIDVGQKRELKK